MGFNFANLISPHPYLIFDLNFFLSLWGKDFNIFKVSAVTLTFIKERRTK